MADLIPEIQPVRVLLCGVEYFDFDDKVSNPDKVMNDSAVFTTENLLKLSRDRPGHFMQNVNSILKEIFRKLF